MDVGQQGYVQECVKIKEEGILEKGECEWICWGEGSGPREAIAREGDCV